MLEYENDVCSKSIRAEIMNCYDTKPYYSEDSVIPFYVSNILCRTLFDACVKFPDKSVKFLIEEQIKGNQLMKMIYDNRQYITSKDFNRYYFDCGRYQISRTQKNITISDISVLLDNLSKLQNELKNKSSEVDQIKKVNIAEENSLSVSFRSKKLPKVDASTNTVRSLMDGSTNTKRLMTEHQTMQTEKLYSFSKDTQTLQSKANMQSQTHIDCKELGIQTEQITTNVPQPNTNVEVSRLFKKYKRPGFEI